MEKIKKIPYTIVALGLIGGAAIAAAFQEVGAAMSGVFVQLHWCAKDDSLCILAHWGLIAGAIVFFAGLLDLYNRKRRREENNETKPEPTKRVDESIKDESKEKTIEAQKVNEEIDIPKSARQMCRLAEEFSSSFRHIRDAFTLESEKDSTDVWGIRQQIAHEHIKKLVEIFQLVKYHFDCRVELEQNIVRLMDLFGRYSRALKEYQYMRSQQAINPRGTPLPYGNLEDYMDELFRDKATNTFNEVDNITESIIKMLAPYIRGENVQDVPKFYTRVHHAEFTIDKSSVDEVVTFLFQFLDDIPTIYEKDNVRIFTKGGSFYDPKQGKVTKYGFVGRGEKEVFPEGFVFGKKNNPTKGQSIYLPEMFFISVVGGNKATQVQFDTDDKHVFSLIPQNILKNLKDVFNVSNVKGLPKEPEIIFYNLFVHRELQIENATPEQVMTYIKNSISSTLWYLHIDDIAYDVDQGPTKFYYPEKDNTSIHGIVFAGIKYDLEKKAGGILNRKNGEKFPNLFTVSISSAGLEKNTKLLLKFDTQIQDVEGFYGKWIKSELKKVFVVKEKKRMQLL